MKEWIESVITGLGYPGLTGLMFLENVFPPIPSELIMPLAGFVAAQGLMSFWLAVLAGTLGSVLGALPLYWIGAYYGHEKLRAFAGGKGRYLGLRPKDVDRAKDWFDKRGVMAVFLCRMVPGVRSLISIPAGVSRMPMIPFLVYTSVGSLLWSSALAGAGYGLGANYSRVEAFVDPVGKAVLVVLVVGAIWFVVARRRAMKADTKPASALE